MPDTDPRVYDGMKQDAIIELKREAASKNQQIQVPDEVLQKRVFDGKKVEWMGYETEMLALKMLKNACLAELDKFPTTWEEDAKLAAEEQATMSFNNKSCLILRTSQKTLFSDLIKGCDEIEKLFNMKYEEA